MNGNGFLSTTSNQNLILHPRKLCCVIRFANCHYERIGQFLVCIMVYYRLQCSFYTIRRKMRQESDYSSAK